MAFPQRPLTPFVGVRVVPRAAAGADGEPAVRTVPANGTGERRSDREGLDPAAHQAASVPSPPELSRALGSTAPEITSLAVRSSRFDGPLR